MSRLPEILKHRLVDAGMLALCTWALAAPMLQVFMLDREGGYTLLIICLLALLFSSIAALRRRWLRATLRLAIAASGILYIISSPIPFAVSALIEASASFHPAQHIVLLYSDLLIPLAIALMMPYIRLLMQGEPSFSAPLLLVNVLMVWFAGARQSVAAYIPAMAAVPLLYAYAAQAQPPGVHQSMPARRAFLKAIPIALLIALAALALTPPYRSTIPELEEKADDLRQLINDHFFFTDSRENFTLAAEGYQPMGDKGLGGKPAISNTPVMEVQSDLRVYLRGGILNMYNGRAWYDTLSNERYGYTTMRFAALRDALLDAALPAQNLRAQPDTVSVSMLSPMPSTLFVPQRLRTLSTQEGMVPYLNASSEMFITRNLQPGDAYTLSFESYVAGTQQTDSLAARLAEAYDERYEELKRDYVQLPRHLLPEGQVATLARDIVGGESNPYRMAMLIRDYLKTSFTYTLDVPDAPEDLDFVAHFIQTGKGYCTYFASAMTVLSRSVGLPARYIEGFVVTPAEEGTPVLITGQQAHAWTEIYIPALGWVTFDATATTGNLPPQPEGNPQGNGQDDPPPGQQPQQQEQEEQTPDNDGGQTQTGQDEPEPSPTPEPDPPSEDEQEEPDPEREVSGRPWWILLLVIAALTALGIWRARSLEPVRRAEQQRDPTRKLMIYWTALCQAMARQGKPMLPHETLRAYALRAAPDDQGLQQLADAVSAVIYGKREADDHHVTATRLYYQSAYNSLSRVKRGQLIIGRLMESVKKTEQHAADLICQPIQAGLTRLSKRFGGWMKALKKGTHTKDKH